jgi:alpha-glucosidase
MNWYTFLFAYGRRADGTTPADLVVKVFGDPAMTTFTLWEDDGRTVAFYDHTSRRPVYDRRRTEISQSGDGTSATVRIAAAQGTYDGAVESRNNQIRLILPDRQATAVAVNNQPLAAQPNLAALNGEERGFVNLGAGEIRIKTGAMAVSDDKLVVATLAPL